MRTIKFRAISMCKGEHWIYGDLRHYNRNPQIERWTIHDPETGLETDVDEDTIGQFTGLYDKNGKEIYEGDIVQCGKDVCSVEYSNPFISFVLQYPFVHFFGEISEAIAGEVIGNIYDNPELLKGGQE